MNTGWKCPECGQVNGPHVDVCDHRTAKDKSDGDMVREIVERMGRYRDKPEPYTEEPWWTRQPQCKWGLIPMQVRQWSAVQDENLRHHGLR